MISSTPRTGIFPGFLSTTDGPHSLSSNGRPRGDSPSSSSSSASSSPTTLLPYLCGSPEPASSSSSNTPFPDTLLPPGSPTRDDKPNNFGLLPAKSKTLPISSTNVSGVGAKGRQAPKRRPTPLVLGKARDQMGLDEELAVQRDGTEAARPVTAISVHSDDTSSLNNELQDLSLLRKSVKQNLLARPLDSPLAGSDSDRESSGFLTPNPDRSTFASLSSTSSSKLPDGVHTATVADTLSLLRSSPQLLIIDTRSIGSFLDAHLPRSANISIPSLIFKRFKKSPGGQPTSWDALGGFVSTQAGRDIWDGLQPNKHMDVVIVGATPSDELALVLHGIMKSLVQDGTVRVLRGGWMAVVTCSEAADTLLSGEQSIRSGSTLATSLPPPRSAPVPDMPPPHPPSMPMVPPTPSRALNQRPSMPSLRANGPNAKRNLPSLTIAVGEPAQVPGAAPTPGIGLGTSGRRGPKLSLNLDKPARSATMGSFPRDGPPPTPGLGRSGLLHVDTSSTMAAKTPRTPGFSLNIPRTPQHGSLQMLAHAQSDYPPSPRSFGDIQNSMRPEEDIVHSTSKPPIAPWTSGATARPDGARTPGLMPNGDAHSLDSEDDINLATARNGMAPFIVSTILPSFLYLGPEISSQDDVDCLKRLGVKRILNVAIECDDDAGLDLKKGFKYHRIPMRDIVEESGIAQGMRESCNILDDARLHSAPTYVHCKAGKSRSVTVVLAYLIHANAWTLKTAYAYVAERRKGISPNIGFVAELMQFEESELGLKQSGGVHGEGGGGRKATAGGSGSAGGDNGHDDRVNKNPRYMRESLPPAWSSSLDTHSSRSDRVSPILGGEEGKGRDSDARDEEKSRRQVGDEREVRKNGQWVHHRRAPVDRTTLQPGRRVSKAGLESLRPLQTTSITAARGQGSRPSPAPSPSLKDGGHGGHAVTPAGDGPLKWI
ncbi:hypothetical protein I317_00688 [Kwoniella heveanensis CBS 569]|nr:hypothetical protein I317_00688 [Kwoniella heveanensis CBS 569]